MVLKCIPLVLLVLLRLSFLYEGRRGGVKLLERVGGRLGRFQGLLGGLLLLVVLPHWLLAI
jgi:hypothetical protein